MKALLKLRLLARHQLTAAVGTIADFSTMVGLVELAHLSPPKATIISATIGGIVNFSVSRGWAYRRRHSGTFTSQAARYAVVSFSGALLNAGLLAVVLRVVPVQVPYALARAAVAIVVSVLYSFPAHTRIVFRVDRRERERIRREIAGEGP